MRIKRVVIGNEKIIRFINEHHAEILIFDFDMNSLDEIGQFKSLNNSDMFILLVDQSLLPGSITEGHIYSPQKYTDDTIYVRSEYTTRKIQVDEIEYIESVGNYLKINLTHEAPVMTLMTINAILDKLPEDSFIRIHRSYIVPVSKIKSIGNGKINLSIVQLPIGKRYVNNIKDILKV